MVVPPVPEMKPFNKADVLKAAGGGDDYRPACGAAQMRNGNHTYRATGTRRGSADDIVDGK